VITVSHIHTDHFDPETIGALFRASPRLKLVIPEAETEAVDAKLGGHWQATVGLVQGCHFETAGIRIHAVASAHESVELDASGRSRFLGYVIGFGNWTVYHSGDTVWHPALAESLAPYRIDVALLPINGRGPERKVAGNLTAQEAASLGREIRARIVIPMPLRYVYVQHGAG
jgi:L-ascorbate metabolism protein UlaG (beta-lactamase superfamily)